MPCTVSHTNEVHYWSSTVTRVQVDCEYGGVKIKVPCTIYSYEVHRSHGRISGTTRLRLRQPLCVNTVMPHSEVYMQQQELGRLNKADSPSAKQISATTTKSEQAEHVALSPLTWWPGRAYSCWVLCMIVIKLEKSLRWQDATFNAFPLFFCRDIWPIRVKRFLSICGKLPITHRKKKKKKAKSQCVRKQYLRIHLGDPPACQNYREKRNKKLSAIKSAFFLSAARHSSLACITTWPKKIGYLYCSRGHNAWTAKEFRIWDNPPSWMRAYVKCGCSASLRGVLHQTIYLYV